MSERFFAVDKISAEKAILVDDEGRALSIPLSQFQGGIAETMVLRVPLNEGGEPNWYAAVVDTQETERRRRKSQQFLRALQEHEPGGDVTG
jgi:hypothetical protein